MGFKDYHDDIENFLFLIIRQYPVCFCEWLGVRVIHMFGVSRWEAPLHVITPVVDDNPSLYQRAIARTKYDGNRSDEKELYTKHCSVRKSEQLASIDSLAFCLYIAQ